MSEGEGLDDPPPQHADDLVMHDDQEDNDEYGEEGMADLSLCDASFSAKDSVPTSDHDRISKCTEGVRLFQDFQIEFLFRVILSFNHMYYFRLNISLPVFMITLSNRRILTLRPPWEFSPLKNSLHYGITSLKLLSCHFLLGIKHSLILSREGLSTLSIIPCQHGRIS